MFTMLLFTAPNTRKQRPGPSAEYISTPRLVHTTARSTAGQAEEPEALAASCADLAHAKVSKQTKRQVAQGAQVMTLFIQSFQT